MFLSLLNPKMIIFMCHFLFSLLILLILMQAYRFILGSILEACSMIYLSMLIFGAVAVTNMVKHNKKLSKLSNSCIGAIFLMFGAKLALAA